MVSLKQMETLKVIERLSKDTEFGVVSISDAIDQRKEELSAAMVRYHASALVSEGLLTNPVRGGYKVTPRGQELLDSLEG